MTQPYKNPPKAKPLTSRQYAKTGGDVCPFCRGKDVKVAGAIMPDDGDGASLEVECSDCGRAWKNIYRLAGYEADKTDEATGSEAGKGE